MTTTTSGDRRGISRRAVVAGAAWAVPVVAMAPEARAAACSNICVTYEGTACKEPGRSDRLNPKAYKLHFKITNTPGGIGCAAVVFKRFVANATDAPDYINISAYPPATGPVLGGGVGCTCANCTTNARYPLVPDIRPYPGTAADLSGEVCIGEGQTLDVLITGGAFTDSAQSTISIYWDIVDPVTCAIIYSDQIINIAATTPPCQSDTFPPLP